MVGRSCQTSSKSCLKPIGGPLVERHERLVEQQQVRLGGEGAGQRHAARQAERQLLRIARQHVGNADGLGEPLEVGSRETRRGATRSIFCSTVRQGRRRGSWNMMPMRASGGTSTVPTKRSSRPATMRNSVVLPQPDGPINTVMLSGLTSSTKSRMAGKQRAVGADVRLLLDADFKPACYASVLNVVQWVAPINIRWPA